MIFSKKLFIFVLVFSSVAFDLSFAQYGQSYRNSKYGYSLVLPKEMEISEEPSKISPDNVLCQFVDGSSFSILTAKNAKLKGKTADQLDINDILKSMQSTYTGALLIENDYTNIGGDPALQGKFAVVIEKKDFIISQFYIVRGETLFILQSLAKKDAFDDFENIMQGFILTFAFTDKQESNFFKSEQYEFGINFPEGWKISGTGDIIEANAPDGSGILIEVYKSGDYSGLTANDLSIEDMYGAIKQRLKTVNLIGNRNIRLDNVPALSARYFWRQTIGGKEICNVIMHYYIIRNSKLYILQGMARDTQFPAVEEKMKASLESIRFLK